MPLTALQPGAREGEAAPHLLCSHTGGRQRRKPKTSKYVQPLSSFNSFTHQVCKGPSIPPEGKFYVLLWLLLCLQHCRAHSSGSQPAAPTSTPGGVTATGLPCSTPSTVCSLSVTPFVDKFSILNVHTVVLCQAANPALGSSTAEVEQGKLKRSAQPRCSFPAGTSSASPQLQDFRIALKLFTHFV